ncbi:MAG: hypothetical protein EHM21_17095 [Chloroflexi bacterium]|nr:MAG: hypothetical protein EHM21_17095 [Chloroflexota bacterium]
MKTKKQFLPVGGAVAAAVIVLLLALAIAAPALSRPTLLGLFAPTSTPVPPAWDKIPLKSIAGLTSLNANVNIGVNGMINGKRSQGDLNAELTTNNQGKSKITITGPLLGDIVAQVGGRSLDCLHRRAWIFIKCPKAPTLWSTAWSLSV